MGLYDNYEKGKRGEIMEQLKKAIEEAKKKGNDLIIRFTPYGFKVQELNYKTIYKEEKQNKKGA